MTDNVDAETRRRTMAAVKSGNTVPEVRLRRALHARGLRYRLHVKGLAGSPDLVFPARRAVVFVHGCFWHGHDCGACRIPQTNREYWTGKIGRNVRRDRASAEALAADGWRVATVWECALRGPKKLPLEEVAEEVAAWLGGGGAQTLDVRGVAPEGRTGARRAGSTK